MKAAQVNKCYAKLTPYEQAGLAIEAAARRDRAEIALILDSVERKNYNTIHEDYIRRANGLLALISEYGLQYWQNQAWLMTSLVVYQNSYEENYLTLCKSFDAKLVSMDIALADVCKSLHVSVKAIKSMANCQEESLYTGIVPRTGDDDIVQKFRELFQTAIDP